MNSSSILSSTEPIHPCVRSEFGTLKTAVVSPLSNTDVYTAVAEEMSEHQRNSLVHEILTDRDIHAHAQLPEILKKRGVDIRYPYHPNLPLTPENLATWMGGDIYCHDFVGVVDEHVISSRVVGFRNRFRMYYESILKTVPKEQHTHTDERFTWGDALLTGDHVLVGLEHDDFFPDIQPNLSPEQFRLALECYAERSSGIQALRSILKSVACTRSVITLAMNANSDLDVCLAPLPRRHRNEPRRAIIRAEAFHPASEDALYSAFDEIVPYEDPWQVMGCNILWLDPETPLVPAEATHTVAYLLSLGYDVQTRPLGTLLHNDSTGSGASHGEPGGWRCLTGVLERADDYLFD